MTDSDIGGFRREIILQALALSIQNWEDLGNSSTTNDPATAAPSNLHVCVERITSLLVIRLVAIVSSSQPNNRFKNLSTSGICRKALLEVDEMWPAAISEDVVHQLKHFVERMLSSYHDTPFHNYGHAYHVTISANKLMDLFLNLDSNDFIGDRPPPAFGLRHDPMSLAALLIASLIHDADHKCVSNRQLVIEEHPLSLLYNDISVNEHRSLQLAFEEFLKDEFSQLRSIMFPNSGDYRYFRSTVVDMVLSTDIASPERAQISKSKWKEAFSFLDGEMDGQGQVMLSPEKPRRGSLMSDISMPRVGRSSGAASPRINRRGSNASNNSMVSEVTFDSYTMLMRRKGNDRATAAGRPAGPSFDLSSEDTSSDQQQGEAKARAQRNKSPRRNSTQSYNTANDSLDSFAQESIGLAQKRQGGRAVTRFRLENPDTKFDTGIGLESHDSNSSISLTPPSSDDEDARAPVRGVMVTRSSDRLVGSPTATRPAMPRSRRASTGNVPVRFGSLEGQRIDEDAVINESFRKISVAGSNRRASAAAGMGTSGSVGPERYRKRLGILRSMDFSGESIEVYSRGSIGGSSLSEGMHSEEVFIDEPDELRSSVVLELLLRAADVAHCMQSWENMAKWSSLLFKELAVAYKAKRGHDPAPSWFDNQAKALESYVLPLAYQLDETGIFGEFVGAIFSQRVEDNRDTWLVKGFELTLGLREEVGL